MNSSRTNWYLRAIVREQLKAYMLESSSSLSLDSLDSKPIEKAYRNVKILYMASLLYDRNTEEDDLLALQLLTRALSKQQPPASSLTSQEPVCASSSQASS